LASPDKKNTLNVLFKNIFINTVGLLLYYIVGINLIYPGEFKGYIALPDFGIGLVDMQNSFYQRRWIRLCWWCYTYWTDFLFQGMFAATTATIVSCAVAERIKIGPFMLFVVLYGYIYPIAGSWKWGAGFLDQMDTSFYDFTVTTLVHSVGG
jgi:Amt family ammonium transporter